MIQIIINTQTLVEHIYNEDFQHLSCLATMENLTIDQYVLKLIKNHLIEIEKQIPPIPALSAVFH